MVVRFYFKYQVVFVVKLNDTGIVYKYGYAPVIVPLLTSNVFGRLPDGLSEQIDYMLCPALTGVVNDAVKYLMFTVFGPGLRQRFHLYICRITTKRNKMLLDSTHFFYIKRQQPVLTDMNQIIVRGI